MNHSDEPGHGSLHLAGPLLDFVPEQVLRPLALAAENGNDEAALILGEIASMSPDVAAVERLCGPDGDHLAGRAHAALALGQVAKVDVVACVEVVEATGGSDTDLMVLVLKWLAEHAGHPQAARAATKLLSEHGA